MNALEIAQTRYTAKSYDADRKIPAETFQRLLEALRLTPSSTNVQAWHFVVTDQADVKAKIAESMKGSDDYNIPKILHASHVVVLCTLNDVTAEHLKKVADQEIADGRYSEAEREAYAGGREYYVQLYRDAGKIPMWVECQTHIALGQLLWAAALEGIDTTAIGGYQARVLDESLGLPQRGMHSSVIVALGYHADEDSNADKPKSRLRAQDVLTVL